MGHVVFGKYKLIAELGHGGMADVFLAVQAGPAGLGFRKLTVVKRLRQNLIDDPEFVAMLVDEARIAARLNHPNVVQTNEVGNVGNQYFLAMEYLDGQPLHRLQYRSAAKGKAGETPPFTAPHQYLVLMDALAGLHHAHALLDYNGSPLDIVHRDMTPQNIFVTYEGQVKVVDFGIAKAAGRSSETRQGVVKGKVRYMAPEQALGLPVTRRTDVFAVGIMMWEAATGRRLWRDMDEIQIVRALIAGELPPSPRELDPSVPEEVDRIVRKALALRVEDRYPSADEFRSDIEQHLANSGQLVGVRRELGPLTIALFNDKRAEIRGIIEQQLSTIEDAPGPDLLAMPQDSGSSSFAMAARTSLSPPSDVSPSSASTGANGLASTVAAISAPSSSRVRPILAVGAAFACLIAGVVAWKNTNTTTRTAASTAVAQLDGGTVSVRVTSDPPSARISVDGRPFEPAPLDLRVARDDQSHHLRVEADGYEPRSESLSFDKDFLASITLTPRKSETSTSGGAKPSAAPRPAAPPPFYRPSIPAAKNVEPKVEVPAPPPTAPPPPTKPATSEKPHISLDKADPWAK